MHFPVSRTQLAKGKEFIDPPWVSLKSVESKCGENMSREGKKQSMAGALRAFFDAASA